MANSYDLIILGGGAAAFAAATKTNDLGKRAVMINAGLPLGGTCVNVGCVPSKHLLTVGAEHQGHNHSVFEANSSGDGAMIDFRKAIAGKDHIVSSLRAKNYSDVLASLENVDLVESRGRLITANTVEVAGEIIAGTNILITTGSSTRKLEVPGLEDAGYHTNETIMDLEALPESLLVVGAGPQGLEIAQMFRNFGSEVTVLMTHDRVLPREEPEVSAEIQRSLESDGIKFCMDAKLERVAEQDGLKVAVLADGREVRVSEIFLAPGLRGNSANLGLEGLGIQTDERGFIKVRPNYLTTIAGVYAAGDVTGRSNLETVAAKEGSLAAENALTGKVRTIDYDTIPRAVFTSPEVASVGITEDEEMERYNACACRTVPMTMVPRAEATNLTTGLFKMVIHPQNSKILGMHIVAPHAAELIHEATLAVKFGLTVDDIIDTVHVFPTLSEGIKRAAQAFTRDISLMSCCVE